jgi:hypothetical protein
MTGEQFSLDNENMELERGTYFQAAAVQDLRHESY